LRNTIRNLEILSGRKLGDPENPLLIAMRSALPEYLPGFMPTYLNVGLIPEMLPGLPRRYGEGALGSACRTARPSSKP
jgi:pyruvate,orthophosphate dikinase